MSVTEIQSERLYKLLTAEQKRFLDTYITTEGDVDAAVIAADPDLKGKDKRAVRSAAAKFFKDPNIDILQRKHFAPDDVTPDEFLRFIWRTIKAEKDTKVIASLATLYHKVREGCDANWRIVAPPPERPAPKSDTELTSGSVFDDI